MSDKEKDKPANGDSLVDGKYSVRDLVDLDRLRRIFEKFTQSTGFTIGFLDHPGMNVLVATGWKDICTKFHRACPASEKNCRKSNISLLGKLDKPGQLVIEKCENGLVDCATPIIIKGKHVASLATGQLLLGEPDIQRFKKQAKAFGYDEKKYLEALREVRVVSKEKLKEITAFLGELSGLISELGYANLMAKEEAVRLEKEMSERKRAQQNWRETFDSVSDPIMMLDQDHRIVMANRATTEFLKKPGKEIIGQRCYELVHGTPAPPEFCPTSKALRTKKHEEWEVRLPNNGPWLAVSVDPMLGENGGINGFVHIVKDVTARKASEEKLQLVLETVEQSTQGLAAMDSSGSIIFVNKAFAGMHGYKKEELIGKNFSIFHTPEQMPAVNEANRKLRETGEFSGEVWHARRDGTVFLAWMNNTLLRDAQGKPAGVIGTLQDITERKKAEEELRKSKDFMQLQVMRMPIGCITWDPRFRAMSWNPAAEKIFGYSSGEAMGRHPYGMIVPEEAQPVVDDIWRRLLEGDSTAHSVNENITKDGRKIICKWSNTPLLEPDGTVRGVLSMVEDITEKKMMEQAFHDEAELRKLTVENMTDGLCACHAVPDPPYINFTLWNRQMTEITGYTMNDMNEKGWYQTVYPDPEVQKRARERMDRMRTGDNLINEEWEITRSDGEKRVLSISTAMIRTTDGVSHILALMGDITERKKAEEALKVSLKKEEFLGDLIRNASIAIGTGYPDGRLGEFNKAFCVLTGYSEDELRTVSWNKVLTPPEWWELEAAKMEELHRLKKPVRYEKEYIRKDGSRVPVELVTHAFFDEQGKTLYYFAFVLDITERRRAAASELRYRRLFEAAKDGILIVDADTGMVVDVNQFLVDMLGYSRDEFLEKHLWEIGIFKNIAASKSGFLELQTKGYVRYEDLPLETSSGQKKEVEFISNVYDVAGEKVIQCNIRDISARKAAEIEIQKLAAVVMNSSELINLATPDGKMTFLNEAGSRMLGIDLEDVGKHNIFEIIPDDLKAKVNGALIPSLMSAGRWEGELKYKNVKTGKPTDVYAIFFAIRDKATGVVLYYANTSHDITQQKLSEEERRKIEWMLSAKTPEEQEKNEKHTSYGDLTALNRDGMILKYVGKDILTDMAKDYMNLLGTSSAIYEKNGDYAMGIFSSRWCQCMDTASRGLCGTPDNAEALRSGKWLCHESCWLSASKEAIAKGAPVDVECSGGIRLYAVPIFAGGEVIGAINFGYGDPPRDPAKLAELSRLYKVDPGVLAKEAAGYDSRPKYIIDMAKERLQASARLIGALVERKRAEEELEKYRVHLEDLVKDRTDELESFSYSVSHDLRAPIRAIDGFTRILAEEFGEKLDQEGKRLLNVIIKSTKNMGQLIDDLLTFSRMGRREIKFDEIDMNAVVKDIAGGFAEELKRRKVEIKTGHLPAAFGDKAMIRLATANLVSNALKFTGKNENARIEIGAEETPGGTVYFVRDNGVGFDMKYVSKLFGVFQRLHSQEEFEGTGIGLALVKRIIVKHGGRVWAEGEVGKGATFYFSLPIRK